MSLSSHAVIGAQTQGRSDDKAPAPTSGQSQRPFSSRNAIIGTLNDNNRKKLETFNEAKGSKNMTEIEGELANKLIIEKMKNDTDIVQKLTNKDKISKEIEGEIKKDESESGSTWSQKVKNMLILARTLITYASAYPNAPEKDGTTTDLKGIKEAKAINTLSESIKLQLTALEDEEMANKLIEQLQTYISKAIKTYGEKTKPEIIEKAYEVYTNKNYETLESIPASCRLKYLELLVICQYKTEETIKANELENNIAFLRNKK